MTGHTKVVTWQNTRGNAAGLIRNETHPQRADWIVYYPIETMSQSKEELRQRCLDLMRDISLMERNCEYGHKMWHRAKDTLGRSLAAYRQLGATTADIVNPGGTK